MKQRFIDSTVVFLEKYDTYSDDQLKKLRYGLEGIYLTITKLIVILLLSLILGIFKEVLIVLILFNIIRYFGFGFHAEKSSECLIFSIITFIFVPLLFIKLNTSLFIKLIISGLCIIHYLIWAPADTVKRPLNDKKKRLIRKSLTVLTGIIYVVFIVILDNLFITNLILSSLVIEAIFISPITYSIFRQPYNNYKKNN